MINYVGDLIFGDQPVIYGFGLNSRWNDIKYKGVFNGVKLQLDEAEFNVANFEAVIKDYKEHLSVSEWSMCCEPNIVDELVSSKINIVSVANNHTMDYGRENFDYTVKCLKKGNIGIIGLKECPYIKIYSEGKKIAIIACSYLKVHNSEEPGYLLFPTRDKWVELVNECSDCDRIIAYVHWGSEFVSNPTQKQIDTANEIISAGVDAIIGHHPHILQSNMRIKEKPVIFSVGNFVSDYWQKRLRKTEIVRYENDEFSVIECMINKNGAVEVIGKEFSKITYTTECHNNNVFVQRMRMRVEYSLKIMTNFWKIKEKRKFLSWINKRVKYILKYSYKEASNPEIVYEYYEN